LGGSSSTRPFGDAVLDGIDLDIEGGGSAGFAAFVTRIRSHANGASKKYYVTAAPQCPFPDAFLGSVLNAVGFDAVYVQFSNNFCGLTNFNNVNAWNFNQWDNWAKNTSPNRNVKIYIGAPASSTSAGSGFVDVNTLGNIAKTTRSQFSSFGGIMLWDASQAFANGRFDRSIKNLIAGGGSGTTIPTTNPTTPPTTTRPTTTTSHTTSPGSGSCAGVSAWSSGIAYTGGQRVTFNGHLWTAKWWTQADTPGGPAGVWTDNGSCAASKILTDAATVSEAHATPMTTAVSTIKSVAPVHSAAPASSATATPAKATTASGASSKSSHNNKADINGKALQSSRFFRFEE